MNSSNKRLWTEGKSECIKVEDFNNYNIDKFAF